MNTESDGKQRKAESKDHFKKEQREYHCWKYNHDQSKIL